MSAPKKPRRGRAGASPPLPPESPVDAPGAAEPPASAAPEAPAPPSGKATRGRLRTPTRRPTTPPPTVPPPLTVAPTAPKATSEAPRAKPAKAPPRVARPTANERGKAKGRVVRPTAPILPSALSAAIEAAGAAMRGNPIPASERPTRPLRTTEPLAPDATPPAAPVGDIYGGAAATSDSDNDTWDADSLGAEAAPSPGNYSPAQDQRTELPDDRKRSMTDEVRELERRLRARLTPALPIFHHRRLPLEFLWRRYRAFAMRKRSDVVDDFGRDPMALARWRRALDFLYDRWFRVQVTGGQHLPASGAAILVANHGGALPYDVLLLAHAVRRESKGRELRPLIEDQLAHTPHLGPLLGRLGAVRACPENALRLLSAEQLIAVFPEGDKGLAKPVRDRYRLQRFGRGGYIKLALRTGAPLIPVAIVGSEEVNPSLFRLPPLARIFGLPTLPVTPLFPLLGPLGLLPLPVRWRLHIGPAIDLGRAYGPEAADDPLLVARLAEGVRGTIQQQLDEAVEARKSRFF